MEHNNYKEKERSISYIIVGWDISCSQTLGRNGNLDLIRILMYNNQMIDIFQLLYGAITTTNLEILNYLWDNYNFLFNYSTFFQVINTFNSIKWLKQKIKSRNQVLNKSYYSS